jgi:Na+-translocating ferredoxin:NAD+ oxidoreductase RnfG subunit
MCFDLPARALAVALATLGAVAAQESGASPTVEEAAALAFPEAKIERRVVALTEAEVAAAERASGGTGVRATVFAYEAKRDDKLVGVAYVDAHRVRTHSAKLLVAVDGDGRVARIEVLAFEEPAEYLPRAAFYEQFVGKKLDDELRVKRSIRSVTGATLTTRATVDAVRRVLAVHQVIASRASSTPPPEPQPAPQPKPSPNSGADGPAKVEPKPKKLGKPSSG